MAEGKIAIRIARQFPTARNLPSSSSHLTIYHLLFVFFTHPVPLPKETHLHFSYVVIVCESPGHRKEAAHPKTKRTGRLQSYGKTQKLFDDNV